MSIETQTSPISAAARFGYIPGLDGIRAIAVMLVIIAHLGLDHIIPGGFGVTVFFFISGFLITRLLLAETGAKGKIALGQFYIRRFLRLLPALYVMLVVTGIILIAMGDMPKLWEAVTAFTYTGNYYYVWLAFQDAAAITATDLRIAPWEHLWSLAVEEHFYLLFPLVLVAFRKTPAKAMWACVAICIAALAWRMTALHILDFPPKYNYAATETRLDSIVYGCLLSLILHVKPDSGFLKRLVGPVPLGLAALVLVACFSYRDEAFRQTFRYSLQGMALFVGVLNLYFWAKMGFLIRGLENSVAGWIGRVSYGLYLWHMPAMMFTQRYGGLEQGSAGFVAVSLAATFGATALSYYFVEKPIIGLRRKFGSHVTGGAKRVTVETDAPAVTTA